MDKVKFKKRKIIYLFSIALFITVGVTLVIAFFPIHRQMPNKGSMNDMLPYLSGTTTNEHNDEFAELYFNQSTIAVNKLNKVSTSSGTADVTLQIPNISMLFDKEVMAVMNDGTNLSQADKTKLVIQKIKDDLKNKCDYTTTTLTVPIVNDNGTWKIVENDQFISALSGGLIDKLADLFKSAKVG